MRNFIVKPSVELFPGVTVTKDTVLEYESENVKQRVENLVFHTVANITGDRFESVCETTVHLNEGDVLLYEENGRGYIKPVESFITIAEAIEDLKNIEDLG